MKETTSNMSMDFFIEHSKETANNLNMLYDELYIKEDREVQIDGMNAKIFFFPSNNKSTGGIDDLVFFIAIPEKGELPELIEMSRDNDYSFFFLSRINDYEELYVSEGSESYCGDGEYFYKISEITKEEVSNLSSRLFSTLTNAGEDFTHAWN